MSDRTFIAHRNGHAYLAAGHSYDPKPVMIYKGRQCYVSSTVRTRAKKGWRFYNAVIIRFVDDGSAETMGAATFFGKAKDSPLPQS